MSAEALRKLIAVPCSRSGTAAIGMQSTVGVQEEEDATESQTGDTVDAGDETAAAAADDEGDENEGNNDMARRSFSDRLHCPLTLYWICAYRERISVLESRMPNEEHNSWDVPNPVLSKVSLRPPFPRLLVRYSANNVYVAPIKNEERSGGDHN